MSITVNIADETVVALKKIEGSITVNVAGLPQVSLDHIFNYGLRQILNDAMASAEAGKTDEARAMVQKRLDNLMSGTLRASPVREGDPVKAEAWRLAIDAIEDFIKSNVGKPDSNGAPIRKLADWKASEIRKEAEPHVEAFMATAKENIERLAKAPKVAIKL